MRVNDKARSVNGSPQRGFALIALLALLTVGVLYFLVGRLDAAAMLRRQDEATMQALAEGKEALIGRAVTDVNLPGSLPCPDTSGSGTAAALVGNVCPAYVGWLPWRTLGLEDLRDGSGERLWYALSASLRDDNSARPINSDTAMALTLDGTGVAAIVMAPGPPLVAQVRPSNLAANYLDGANADGNTAYVSLPTGANFNDRMLAVGQQQLFAEVARRIAGDLRGYPGKGLKGYFDSKGFLPCAASISGGPQVPGNSVGFIPFADLSFDANTSNLLSFNNWIGIATYSAPACGTVAANSAIVTIGSVAVSLKFP